jgi:restriction system protein
METVAIRTSSQGPDGPVRRAGFPLRRTLMSLTVGGVFLCGVYLFVERAAAWASTHPVGAVGLGLVAVPGVALAWWGRPSARELRREARRGMAEAEGPCTAQHPGAEDPAAGAKENGEEVEEVVFARGFTAMDADEFEEAVAQLCTRDGCRDVDVVGGAGDLGADVVALSTEGRRVVIQCKRYGESHKVGSQDLQRFGGTCYSVHEADVAVVVTTTTFTDPALRYAESCGIACMDLARLTAWATGAGPAPWD